MLNIVLSIVWGLLNNELGPLDTKNALWYNSIVVLYFSYFVIIHVCDISVQVSGFQEQSLTRTVRAVFVFSLLFKFLFARLSNNY